MYDSQPIEALLNAPRLGSRRIAPTFSRAAAARAIARARSTPNLLMEVGRPWWRWFWPWGRDLLSIMAQPIPTGGDAWSGFLMVIVSSSDRVQPLIGNLRLGLELVGADVEQLVSSMEYRAREGRSYHHAIACIPGSR